MKITRLFVLGVLTSFLLNSCSSEDDSITPEPVNEGDYANGIFILNEGSQSAGTVTYISEDLQTVEQEIYATVNNGDDLGLYAQSMFFSDELAFIIGGGSNLITVVDKNTFELVGKVETDLNAPRYGAVVGGKAYVTNHAGWDTNQDDYIAVIDIASLEVEETIIMGDYAESIIENNGLLYIENAAYGTGNAVSVFNPATNAVERTFTVSDGLNSIDIENDMLFALSSGELAIIDLTTNNTLSEISFSEEFSGARNIDVEGDNLYYTIGSAVYVLGMQATGPAESALIDYNSDSAYGVMYGFEVEDGRIYIADGGDFSSNSFVEIYTTEGELLERVDVGVGPNGIYFNN